MDDAATEPERAPADEPTTLPRRSRQRHLEPQLREPAGSGNGTPFAAFADPDPTTPTAGAREIGAGAAAFQRGTGRRQAED